jgi:hypothetical protein
MRIALVYIQVRCEQPEGPEENVSRYTGRPGTLGLTLVNYLQPTLISTTDALCLWVRVATRASSRTGQAEFRSKARKESCALREPLNM